MIDIIRQYLEQYNLNDNIFKKILNHININILSSPKFIYLSTKNYIEVYNSINNIILTYIPKSYSNLSLLIYQLILTQKQICYK